MHMYIGFLVKLAIGGEKEVANLATYLALAHPRKDFSDSANDELLSEAIAKYINLPRVRPGDPNWHLPLCFDHPVVPVDAVSVPQVLGVSAQKQVRTLEESFREAGIPTKRKPYFELEGARDEEL